MPLVILNQIYGIFLPLSRKPLFISSLNSAVLALLFFVAIFTPFHGTLTLVSIGTVLDYVLRVLGIMIFKTIEILGRKRERNRRKFEATQSPDMNSPKEDIEENLSEDQEKTRVYERSRTMDSSLTAINEEAPLGANRQCNEAVTKHYRIPGRCQHVYCPFVAILLKLRNCIAINIEHHVERLGAFVTIMLGEMVVNIFFTSTSASGLNPYVPHPYYYEYYNYLLTCMQRIRPCLPGPHDSL